jgi:hypothetical protein
MLTLAQQEEFRGYFDDGASDVGPIREASMFEPPSASSSSDTWPGGRALP